MKDTTKQHQPTCVLICGRTELLGSGELKKISEYYRVVVSGSAAEETHAPSEKIHSYCEAPCSERFRHILQSYTPDVVWYFSGFADDGRGFPDEPVQLEALMRLCSENDVEKVVCISSVNSLRRNSRGYTDEKALQCAQGEELLTFLAERYAQKLVLLRLPALARLGSRDDALGRLFSRLEAGEDVELPYDRAQVADCISVADLAEMLLDITEETLDQGGAYTVFSDFRHTYGELADALSRCFAGRSVTCGGAELEPGLLEACTQAGAFRKTYGAVVMDDVLGRVEDALERYRASSVEQGKTKSLLRRLSAGRLSTGMKVLELLLLFALLQTLLPLTSESVFFRYVDLRLFYVLMLGAAHGMLFGVLAGVLAGVSLFFAFSQIGVDAATLFYNMDYWFPFTIYLITGAVVGYMKSANDQKNRYAEEEMRSLREKYTFLNQLYQSVIDNKSQYKRQLLGYDDSFGKIYEAVERLDSALPADIFMNSVATLEELLDNDSIAVYTLDEYQNFARLVSCSRKLSDELSRSLRVSEVQPVYDTIVRGDTWRNTEFSEGLPAYANAIVEEGRVRLMIFLYRARGEQMSLYYLNLFTILCNLIRMSFLRALEYQDAIERDKYLPGTNILQSSYFLQEVESQKEMAEAGVASFLLLRLRGEPEALNEKAHGMIRHSDVMGMDRAGHCYLLLIQMERSAFSVVEQRLLQREIEFEIVEDVVT